MKKLIPVVILVVLAALVGYKMYNKPHRDIAKEKVIHTLTADELFNKFEADEESANKEFLDNVIEVMGRVETLETNKSGQVLAVLTAENAMMGGVEMAFKGDDGANLKKGQTITAKCRCVGKDELFGVKLDNCTLAK